jgi:hypothetical protein
MLELPGKDSNLRPIGYTYLQVSLEGGLSHHPSILITNTKDVGRCENYRLGSSSLVSAPFWLLVTILN